MRVLLRPYSFSPSIKYLLQSLTGFHFYYLSACDEFLQIVGTANEHGEGSKVHGNHGFCFQKITCIGSFTRTHSVVVADGNHGDIRLIEIVDDLHIAKHIGIASVINFDAVRELNHKTASFATVNNLVAIRNATGVVGMNHRDFNIVNGLCSALV